MASRPHWAFCAVFIGLVALPGVLSAQGCIGIPTRDGGIAVTVQYVATKRASGFGGTFTADLNGPVSLQAGYRFADPDNGDSNINLFNAAVAIEIPRLPFSVCPYVAAEYSTHWETLPWKFGLPEPPEDELVATLNVPLGLAIGRAFATGPSARLILYGVPHYLYALNTRTYAGRETASESVNGFGAELGFRLAGRTIFGGGGVSLTNLEDSNPVFALVAGLAFGRHK
jgi:hypothetical protein